MLDIRSSETKVKLKLLSQEPTRLRDNPHLFIVKKSIIIITRKEILNNTEKLKLNKILVPS